MKWLLCKILLIFYLLEIILVILFVWIDRQIEYSYCVIRVLVVELTWSNNRFYFEHMWWWYLWHKRECSRYLIFFFYLRSIIGTFLSTMLILFNKMISSLWFFLLLLWLHIAQNWLFFLLSRVKTSFWWE